MHRGEGGHPRLCFNFCAFISALWTPRWCFFAKNRKSRVSISRNLGFKSLREASRTAWRRPRGKTDNPQKDPGETQRAQNGPPRHHSVQRPYGRSIERPHGPSVERPHGRSIERPHGRSIERPHSRSTERACGRCIERPHGRSIERPCGHSTEWCLGRPF